MSIGACLCAFGWQSCAIAEEIELPAFVEAQPSPMFRLRGRIDTDFLWSDQTADNRDTFGELGEVVGVRRARIGAEGDLSANSHYVAELDMASGNVVLRDVYLAFRDVPVAGEFTFGRLREPFSLEGGTSANSFAFMERSPINNLDPARNWGIGFTQYDASELWTFAGGVFQSGTDASDLEYGPGSATAITARVTGLALYENDGERLIHIGAAVSERIPNEGVVIIRQRPSSPLLELGDSSESPFLPKVEIPSSFQQLINLQFAAVDGPLWAQAEFYGSIIDQKGGAPVFFHGSHFDVGYFLTGEQRKYLTNSGVFGPVTVHRPVIAALPSSAKNQGSGYGAWELTARFSYLDFTDGSTPLNSDGLVFGVELPQITAGVNWYLTDNLRAMFNFTHAVPNEANTGVSSASFIGMRVGLFW